jgi:hypothetical protein
MSAGSISLNSAIRTYKVDTSYANKIQSDRFLNHQNMVCPVWNGTDTAGRSVSSNSFKTKHAGCNGAQDRIAVENSQRPQYAEYVGLSANGIHRDMSGVNGTGNFGGQQNSVVKQSNSYKPYKTAMAQNNVQFNQSNHCGGQAEQRQAKQRQAEQRQAEQRQAEQRQAKQRQAEQRQAEQPSQCK